MGNTKKPGTTTRQITLLRPPANFFDLQRRAEIAGGYLRLNLKNTLTAMLTATKTLAKEYTASSNDPDFYGKTRGYILELEHWHATDKMKQAGMIAIASQTTGKRFLEFGCGIADTSALAVLAGARVIHAMDLPSETMSYAKWRLPRIITATNKVSFIESTSSAADMTLKKNYYDVISAEDVFEHVPRPEEFAERLFHALKKGGSLYFSTEYIHSDSHPMHLKQNQQFHGTSWLNTLEDLGYVIVSPCQASRP